MDSSEIIYPAFAMFMLTASVVAYMGGSRIAAIRRREVSIRYYRRYTEGTQTPRLEVIGRHAQNHFEMPPLFYVAVLFLYSSGNVTPLAVALAWGFFASRCVHSFIHLGSNNVSLRFAAYAVGGLIVVGLWLLLLGAVASEAGS